MIDSQDTTPFCQQTSRLSFIAEINSIYTTLLLKAILQILHSIPPSASSSPRSITYSSSINQNAFSILNNNLSRYIVRSFFFPQIMKQSNSNAPLNVVLETGDRTPITACCGYCPRHRVAQRTPPNATTAGMRMEWRRMTHHSEPRLCTARSSGRPAVLAPHQPVDLLQPALLPPDGRQIAVCWACATHGLLQP